MVLRVIREEHRYTKLKGDIWSRHQFSNFMGKNKSKWAKNVVVLTPMWWYYKFPQLISNTYCRTNVWNRNLMFLRNRKNPVLGVELGVSSAPTLLCDLGQIAAPHWGCAIQGMRPHPLRERRFLAVLTFCDLNLIVWWLLLGKKKMFHQH